MVVQHEPCMACGEETAAGSPLYSDRRRRVLDTGQTVFLCILCSQRITGSREVHDLSDEQRTKLENAAFAFGAFAPGGH